MDDREIYAETFNPYQLCFPIFKAKFENGDIITKSLKFLGSSIILNKDENKLITCKHLYDKINRDEKLCIAIHETNKPPYLLKDIKFYNNIDLMTAKFECEDDYTTLINLIDNIRKPILNEIYLGLDLRAYGYTSLNPNAEIFKIQIEIRKGYVTLSSPDNERTQAIGGNSTHCLSFDSPNGFSGGPVLLTPNSRNAGIQPIGIIFNNLESETLVHEVNNIDDTGKYFKETKSRVVMHGVFHSLEDIKNSLSL